MSRGTSPLRDRMVFVVGARRSGTMWLQRALCTHPDLLGVPSETHLFSHGIEPLAALFQHDSPGSIAVGSTYIERDRFLDAVRDFCDQVFVGVRDQLRPDADLLVERTPWHARVLPLLGAVYPDARVVHIVRDGRDVARSLLRRHWGPATMAEAAEEWRSSVALARAAAPELPHYRECRYEDLLDDPVAGVEELLEWLGCAVGAEVRAQLDLELRTPVNLIAGERPGAGKWREELSADDLDTFGGIAGALLSELGYAEHAGPPPLTVPGPPAATAAALVPVTAPGATMVKPRATLRAGLRRRLVRAEVAAAPAQSNQRTFDALLRCVNGAGSDELADLFEPTAQITVLGAATEWRARGPQAVDRLRTHLDEHRPVGGRLVRCDVYPLGVTVTGIVTNECEGGLRNRVLVAEMPTGKISRLACYEL